MTKTALHWTSTQQRLGYRHFKLVAQGGKGANRWLELEALLDRGQRMRVTRRELADRGCWRPGLHQVVEPDPINPVADTSAPTPPADPGFPAQ